MIEIVVERGGVEIARMQVRGDMTIGRAASAQVCLDDPNVNRAHARLLVQGGSLVLVDLDSVQGTFLDGRRVRGSVRFDQASRVTIGGYTIRRADGLPAPRPAMNTPNAPNAPNASNAPHAPNPALDEQTGPDDAAPRRSAAALVMPKVEVTDATALQAALPHVRLGRHFVFVDDAQAVMPPSGRMQRLLGYKQKKGRIVKPLADAAVEIAGARIHPVSPNVERLAGLASDRDLYRAEQDVVRLLATMPGGGSATIRVTMNGAPFTERQVDLPRGLCVESLAMLLPGKYEAQLAVGDANVGEPVRFTVAEYTLAPLSARLIEHRLDRAAQTLAVVVAVESYAVAWDRPLRATLIENGREMSEIAMTMVSTGRYAGKARVVGEGPFKVRLVAADDAARTAEVALPGTRRSERQLTLAGELGKELFVSLLPEPGSITVRGMHLTHGDFVATPIVVDDPVGGADGHATLRANEDIESLVVAAYDPARDGYSIFDLGDLPRGKSTSIEVPRPMCVAFVGCYVNGEPFEAFTSLWAPERPIKLDVPERVLPGSELAITVRTGRKRPVSMILCVRDERLVATDTPQTTLASATKRAIEASTAGLGDDFRFVQLADLVTPSSPAVPHFARVGGGGRSGIHVMITERGGRPTQNVYEQNEITIGRVQGNDIVLAKGNISKKHARVVLRDGKMIIVDLRSTNGTFVNDKKISSPQVLKDGDRIFVGDFSLVFMDTGGTEMLVPAGASLSRQGAHVQRRDISVLGDDDDALFSAEGAAGSDAFDDDSVPVAAARAQVRREITKASVRMMEPASAARPAGRPAPARAEPAPKSAPVPVAEALWSKGRAAPPPKSASFDEDVEEKSVVLGTRDVERLSVDVEEEPYAGLDDGVSELSQLLDDGGDEGATRDFRAHAPRQSGGELAKESGLKGEGGGGGAGRAQEPAPVRASFPEVLFCALVEVDDGEQIRIPAGDALGAFAVEAFFVDDGDFGEARARVQVDKPVRVDLDIASEIDPDDRVVGTLRLGCNSGSARVSLVRDGRVVALRTVDGRIVAAADALPSGVELVFDAGPGVWLATVEDPATGESDTMEVRVGTPGVYRTLVREIVLLDKGKRMTLDGEMLSLRVLPGIDEPFQMLAEATAGYGHMCCEQTAAKILSAVVMFLSADEPHLRQRAEEIILAGIARERSMYKRGRGFAMYPEQSSISDYYTPKVVQYLWSLDGLADVNGLSRQLVDAVREGIQMADDVAHAFALRRVPEAVKTIEDAYAVAVREPRRQRECLELVARTVSVDEAGGGGKNAGSRLKAPVHRVAERATLAYAAAVLFASGKTQTAMRLANDVLKQLNEQGRLYSTVDSVAAIALMVQLRKTGIIGGGAEVIVNGKKMTALDASMISDQVEVIEVKEGVCVVEVTRAREDRWAEARSTFPLKCGFRDDGGRSITRFRRGDKAELVVTLPKGYTEGDLVHVCLPPAMAWLEGGGRVKRFSSDFEGRDEVRIPIVVTHTITGKQRFAVAVRNMFQEERAATPGLMVIEGA